jgi:hypothetical protein
MPPELAAARSRSSEGSILSILLSLIEHPWLLFPVLLVGLTLVVGAGFRLRHESLSMDEERQPLIESARNGLGVLLSLLLRFSLPMA